ncbi:MAG: bifunctional phosphoribosylaminoimidazolecarboxamide formyltransferase/IMP cyclohydrolase [Clostridiales bacterium]|jgi:phosphoribosylaminoimidazolecarboxamide formyltransferase/IMP cyclohydrolase|nr:bifunctional phosphoribosylaminoimidazolecarboxamide formyltransferase/IMP cyclohydrolase [Clostridiales bacterium]
MKKRALISVSDKTGVVEAAKRLEKCGYEIVSTGGTLNALRDAGVGAVNISEITGFPECLDGRVKTLHPAVHAGLLAMRGNPAHMKQLEDLHINAIDVVIVNLYPFKATVMKGADFFEAVENIDIGGPTMLRSAAKNYQDVVVLVDPADYDRALGGLESGGVDIETKKYLMYKVFAHTAVYDSMISNYLKDKLSIAFPDTLTLAYEKKEQMRYGENPHQAAAVYCDAIPVKNSLIGASQLNGKQLSYNNINDCNGAVELLKEFAEPTVVAVKHANPCGVSSAGDVYTAYLRAYEADPVSIYGGIVAVNRAVDGRTAREMVKIFLEIVIAPDFSVEAVEVFKAKPNLRVLKLADFAAPNAPGLKEFKKVYGGLIYQEADYGVYDEIRTVTKKAPTKAQLDEMEFAMKVVKHCKSNAIVFSKDKTTLGIGVGQTNRIWAARQAGEHATRPVTGGVMASDAFFPFSDCVEAAADLGLAAIVHPGGSIRDEDSVKAADARGLAMCVTGVRHFKH